MTPKDLMDALASLLALEAPPGAAVHRFPMRPLNQDQLPAMVPYLTALNPRPGQDAENDVREYDAQVRVECRAKGWPMEDVLWPCVLHVQRTMLTAPPYLDGWAMDVEELSIDFDAYERDRVYCGAALDYRLRVADALRATADGPPLREIEPCEHLGGA
jgi:hypothetical protein